MRMALLVTHKRITAKIRGRRFIDADIKLARFIGYCWIPAAHREILFSISCWLEFSNSTFFIFFHRFYYFFIITKLATTVIALFTLSQTRSSFPYMVCGSQSSSKKQNQIFSENRSKNGKVAVRRNQTSRNSG